MRNLNAAEIDGVAGAIGDGDEPPMVPQQEGVSSWEWDQLMELLEEQGKRGSRGRG